MFNKLKRIITGVVASSIMLTFMSITSFASDIKGTSQDGDTSDSKLISSYMIDYSSNTSRWYYDRFICLPLYTDNNLGSSDTKYLQTKSKVSFGTQALYPFVNLKDTSDGKAVLDLINSGVYDIKSIEMALSNNAISVVPTGGYSLSVHESNGSNMKHNIIIHTPPFGKTISKEYTKKDKSNYSYDIQNVLRDMTSIGSGDIIEGFACIYYKNVDDGDIKFYLRYQAETDKSIGFTDYDITDLMYTIKNFNTKELEEYPICNYLNAKVNSIVGNITEEKYNEQIEKFNEYKKDNSSFSGKSIFDYIGNFFKSYSKDKDSANFPRLNSDNPKVNTTSKIYFNALNKANLFNVRQDSIPKELLLTESDMYPATDSGGNKERTVEIIDDNEGVDERKRKDDDEDEEDEDSNTEEDDDSSSDTSNNTSDIKNKLTFDIIDTISEANKVAEKYNSKSASYTQPGIVSNASLFNDLIRYRYGKLTGATERSSGSSATDEIVISPSLERLLVDSNYLSTKVLDPSLWEQITSMKQWGFEVKALDLMDTMTSIQMLEYYASSACSDSGLNEKGYNEKLEEVIEQKENEEASTGTNGWSEVKDGEIIRQIRAYMQIKEGLDYINVEPWTDNLKYICGLYDKISKFPLSEDFDDDGVDDGTEPLKRFFSVTDSTMSKNYLTGVALSATYIPMQTNLYDPASIRVLKDNNKEWLGDFHVKYGFYRKALMIDTNINAAVDHYITDSRGPLRIATLKDLLEHEKDIVLYVDDNFYNADEVAKMTDKVYERLANTEQAGISNQSFEGFLDNLFSNSIEHVLKTGPNVFYDESTVKHATQYGEEKVFSWETFTGDIFTDGILFSSGRGNKKNNEIKEGLDQRDYSIKQTYAILSGIYRHNDLVTILNTIAAKPAPVFISSPTLYNVNGIDVKEFNTIYNYYMLRNLESAMGVDYRTTLDINNPIYIDIYGNIVTESGLVIIPAASNATLYPGNKYTPYTLGFMDLYSKGDNIKAKAGWDKDSDEVNNLNKFLTDFIIDKDSNTYIQKNYEYDGTPVNPQRPSVADKVLLEKLFANQVSILNNNGYDFNQRVWLTTEVLRGAPLENIDKEKEGIQGKRDINKYSLYMSYKLDEIADAILPTTNGNSLISMPNLSFMDGFEYLVLFIYKGILLLFVVYVLYRIYIDAVGGRLGIGTFWKCISTIVVFCVCMASIPTVISLSYNEPNKIFLQNEIKYINLLNSEKNNEGREISAVGVEEPKSQTELYLKIDSINVPWYKIMREVMFAPVGTTLGEIYEEELTSNIFYGYEGLEVVNDGVYIKVDNIFDSSNVIYNTTNHFLYQYVNTTPTASYFIPYYYIMDNFISSVNRYNTENNIKNVSTKIQSDGSVKTMGMIGDYLLSEYFMKDDNDPLGLYDLYAISTNERKDFINMEGDAKDTVKQSLWYIKDYYDDEDIASRIDQLYSYMRSYVAQNREMLGRVTDEVFIKTMMLDMSMKYNNLFKIPAARGIEIFGIDSRDIIRLSVTSKSDSIINSSYSFGRFIYEVSGGLGVILTAILMVVLFITSIVKPLLVIFLSALLIYNVLIKSMISLERGKTVEGLLYVLSVLVVTNSIYSIFIKLSMSLPGFGLNPVLSILGQIVIQIVYLLLVGVIVSIILKDYANMGYNGFRTIAMSIANVASGATHSLSSKLRYTEEQQSYMESAKMKADSEEYTGSDNLREEMRRRDKKRESAEEETAFMDKVFDRDINKDKDEQ